MYRAEWVDERTIIFTYDPLVTVTFRLRKSKLDQLDKIVTALKLNSNGVRISRTLLIQRIIERIIENPHLLAEIL
jgi:hypothetical protein